MRLFDEVLNLTKRCNCNLSRALVKDKARETASAVNTGGLSHIRLINEADSYTLIIGIKVGNKFAPTAGNHDVMLSACIKVDDESANLVGIYSNFPVFTDNDKEMLNHWREHIDKYVAEFNTRLYGKANELESENSVGSGIEQ